MKRIKWGKLVNGVRTALSKSTFRQDLADIALHALPAGRNPALLFSVFKVHSLSVSPYPLETLSDV